MRLLAYVALENLPSRRVLEKAGFVFTDYAEHNGMNYAVYELPGELLGQSRRTLLPCTHAVR